MDNISKIVSLMLGWPDFYYQEYSEPEREPEEKRMQRIGRMREIIAEIRDIDRTYPSLIITEEEKTDRDKIHFVSYRRKLVDEYLELVNRGINKA